MQNRNALDSLVMILIYVSGHRLHKWRRFLIVFNLDLPSTDKYGHVPVYIVSLFQIYRAIRNYPKNLEEFSRFTETF